MRQSLKGQEKGVREMYKQNQVARTTRNIIYVRVVFVFCRQD